jgi:uncharacterized protein (TIGR02271 family)
MAKGKRKRGKAAGTTTKRAANATTGAKVTAARQAADADVIAVPVAEERLNVAKQAVELGEVELRKTVVREQVEVPVELRREEVYVQQVDTPDRPVGTGEDLFQEGVIRVAVRGEEAVVTKEAVVTGEVLLGKEQLVERQTITDTVRREQVDVERHYNEARAGFERHFAGRGGGEGRTFADAEPNYRSGFSAGSDARYAGREFDEIEPELRQSHGSGGGSWAQLRDEIRAGWDAARGR